MSSKTPLLRRWTQIRLFRFQGEKCRELWWERWVGLPLTSTHRRGDAVLDRGFKWDDYLRSEVEEEKRFLLTPSKGICTSMCRDRGGVGIKSGVTARGVGYWWWQSGHWLSDQDSGLYIPTKTLPGLFYVPIIDFTLKINRVFGCVLIQSSVCHMHLFRALLLENTIFFSAFDTRLVLSLEADISDKFRNLHTYLK